jgi:hypothetical protein
MRSPTPYGPPVQPVFTSQQATSCSAIFLPSRLGVHRRVQRHERRAEAGAERRLRLVHAPLGAGHLRGVAGEEVVHRLLGRQLRDRRQHPEGVGRQHDDVARVPAMPSLTTFGRWVIG